MTNHHYVTMLKYKGRIRFTPHYLDPKATKGFEDVIIISKEGQQFVLNNCLFAAIRYGHYQVLKWVAATYKEWLETSLVRFLAHDFLDGPRQRRAFWADLASFVDMGRLFVIRRNYREIRL